MDDKPVLHCIVGMRLPEGDYVTTKEHVSLEDAVAYAQFGWEVWVDPWDSEALARWEQLHRQPKPKWNRW